MSTDVTALQRAVEQLKTASGAVTDEMFASQLELTSNVLANAVASAREGVNAARVADIEFAFNDVVGVVDQLTAADAQTLHPIVETLRAEVRRLKTAMALPPDLVSGIKDLQAKLKVRRAAIERQTYIAGSKDPLPHPPAELRNEALRLRERLKSAGFAVPALDALIEAKDEFRLHNVNDLVNELDVVLG